MKIGLNNRFRFVLRVAIPFLLIPMTVVLGAVVFDAKRHIWVSCFVAFFSVLLFLMGVEKKVVGTRRMVIVAVMITLCVVGRWIPFFKPVAAITVITAIYLGSESGFLVGALSALLSNFYFGQGPWTPFQMLAWGMIGWLAGRMKKTLRKSRAALLTFGVLSGMVFSFIMDIWAVLWYEDTFRMSQYWVAIGAALPHTILYAVSNFVFLWFLAKPFGEKLSRITIKYGV